MGSIGWTSGVVIVNDIEEIGGTRDGVFRTTRWSVVLAAGQLPSPESGRALEQLCGVYWYPIYAWLRRQGHAVHDAQDLTQSFLAHLLQNRRLHRVSSDKGRFRSFLLASLKHFIANERDKMSALKRGGQISFVSVDDVQAENRYSHEPAHSLTPEKIFERTWAMTLLQSVLGSLRDEYTSDGKGPLFEVLQHCLTGDQDGLSYAEVATRLNLTEGAVKMVALRLRRRFGELLRQEIEQTVEQPRDVDDEIRTLFAALRP